MGRAKNKTYEGIYVWNIMCVARRSGNYKVDIIKRGQTMGLGGGADMER